MPVYLIQIAEGTHRPAGDHSGRDLLVQGAVWAAGRGGRLIRLLAEAWKGLWSDAGMMGKG